VIIEKQSDSEMGPKNNNISLKKGSNVLYLQVIASQRLYINIKYKNVFPLVGPFAFQRESKCFI